MARSAALLCLALLVVSPGPAVAIEVCRANALGQTVCTGTPTPELPRPEPFRNNSTGLGRVQAPARPVSRPGLISSSRTNAFGDTITREGEVPRPRPRVCGTDAFGNLTCPGN